MTLSYILKILENPQKAAKTNKQVQESCRVQDQNTKIYLFLYTSSEQSKNEIKKANSLTIASNRIKCLVKNLTNEVKALYTENFKHC